MGKRYEGQVRCEEVEVGPKPRFDWTALELWIISLLISMLPVYISMLRYLGEHGGLDMAYWFQCITKEDVLWVFATLLLFSFFNSLASALKIKRRNGKKRSMGLYIWAGFIFVVTEATWLGLKYLVITPARWPIYLGMGLMACSLAIAIPLEVDHIKNGG